MNGYLVPTTFTTVPSVRVGTYAGGTDLWLLFLPLLSLSRFLASIICSRTSRYLLPTYMVVPTYFHNFYPILSRPLLHVHHQIPRSQHPTPPLLTIGLVRQQEAREAQNTPNRASMPGNQDGGGGQSSAANRSKASTLNGDKGEPGEHRQISFTGYFSTIISRSKAYPKDTKAEIVLLPNRSRDTAIHISTSLGKITRVLRRADPKRMMKLTLFLSDVYEKSNKRRRTDGSCRSAGQHEPENEISTKVKEIDSNLCGNCGGNDHKAAFCVKVGKSGWMEACCKCDSLQHTYDHCPHRRQMEDFQYLIINRGNKGPVKCSLSLGLVIARELDRDNSLYQDTDVIALPYSPRFAEKLALSPLYVYYRMLRDDHGNEIKDDFGNVIELSRHNKSLCHSANNLKHERWAVDQDEMYHSGKRCENCFSSSRSIYHCDYECGFCGSDEHLTFFCKDQDKACFCEKYPSHSRFTCDEWCWYCEGKTQCHGIRSCPAICHYCLKSGHVTEKCQAAIQASSRVCSRCPKGTYHYPSMHMTCPGENCTRLLSMSPCEEHCLNCG
ncbi:hypothetical protein F5Y03DRAFT_268797 [Xylaria venustula]|nr:hypothetical protein F5Y03DRAFT_268797 [Xylaria venustula]